MEKDMISEIFLRLPLKSLTCCKTLSKYWNQFISCNSTFHHVYTSRLLTLSSSPLLLGFFLTKSRRYPDIHAPLNFLPLNIHASKLVKQSPPFLLPQPFDRSLRFVGHGNHKSLLIRGSSNGFLLCCAEEFHPVTYYICNPITKDWIALPKPKLTSQYVQAGFICRGDPRSLSTVSYKVVRAVGECQDGDKLTIDIFDSCSSTWEVVQRKCNYPFRLSLIYPSVVINEKEVVHWLALTDTPKYRCVVVFDKRLDFLQRVEFPGNKQRIGDCLGMSNGLVLYARYDRRDLEIFVLKEMPDYTKKCLRKWKVNLQLSMGSFPQGWTNCFLMRMFHPMNPLILFLTYGKAANIVLYNVKTSTMTLLGSLGANSANADEWSYNLYAYVWPKIQRP